MSIFKRGWILYKVSTSLTEAGLHEFKPPYISQNSYLDPSARVLGPAYTLYVQKPSKGLDTSFLAVRLCPPLPRRFDNSAVGLKFVDGKKYSRLLKKLVNVRDAPKRKYLLGPHTPPDKLATAAPKLRSQLVKGPSVLGTSLSSAAARLTL
jgi:hypothetical protein